MGQATKSLFEQIGIEMCAALQDWAGEKGESEGAVECLKRLLRELNESRNRGIGGIDCTTAHLLEALSRRGGAAGALGEAGLLFEKKGQDYNTGFQRDDYFPMGLQSYAQMLWVKCMRVLSFAKQPRPPVHEKVRDTLLDLINYAAFAADWLKRSAPKAASVDEHRSHLGCGGVGGGGGGSYPNKGGGGRA